MSAGSQLGNDVTGSQDHLHGTGILVMTTSTGSIDGLGKEAIFWTEIGMTVTVHRPSATGTVVKIASPIIVDLLLLVLLMVFSAVLLALG